MKKSKVEILYKEEFEYPSKINMLWCDEAELVLLVNYNKTHYRILKNRWGYTSKEYLPIATMHETIANPELVTNEQLANGPSIHKTDLEKWASWADRQFENLHSQNALLKGALAEATKELATLQLNVEMEKRRRTIVKQAKEDEEAAIAKALDNAYGYTEYKVKRETCSMCKHEYKVKRETCSMCKHFDNDRPCFRDPPAGLVSDYVTMPGMCLKKNELAELNTIVSGMEEKCAHFKRPSWWHPRRDRS